MNELSNSAWYYQNKGYLENDRNVPSYRTLKVGRLEVCLIFEAAFVLGNSTIVQVWKLSRLSGRHKERKNVARLTLGENGDTRNSAQFWSSA